MQNSNDQRIIEALIEFDDASRDLHNSIIVHKEVVTHDVMAHVIILFKKAQTLYEAIYEKWTPATPKQPKTKSL